MVRMVIVWRDACVDGYSAELRRILAQLRKLRLGFHKMHLISAQGRFAFHGGPKFSQHAEGGLLGLEFTSALAFFAESVFVNSGVRCTESSAISDSTK